LTEANSTGTEVTSTGCEATATVAEFTSTGHEFTLIDAGTGIFKTAGNTMKNVDSTNRHQPAF